MNKAGLIAGLMVVLAIFFAFTPGTGVVAAVCALLALFTVIGSRKG